jgi:hypothetical protein
LFYNFPAYQQEEEKEVSRQMKGKEMQFKHTQKGMRMSE